MAPSLEDPAAAAARLAAAKTAGKVVTRAIPVVGQALTVIDAGDGAVTDYNKARAAGDSVASSIGSGGLGALNRLTFGGSDWLFGRR